MTRAEAAAIARAAKSAALLPLVDRFWAKVDRRGADECWPWLAGVRNKDEGYGAFSLDGRKNTSSNRVAWIFTFGEIPCGLFVLHSCDNPPCCNPTHLFLGTNKENNDDKVAKRRHVFGARVNTAKLTEADALTIKMLRPHGRAPYGYRKDIANRYGIDGDAVTEIWNGTTWRHVNA